MKWPALLLAAGLLAGCGGGDSAQDALRETTDQLAKLHSGTLHFDLALKGQGGGEQADIGFAVDGPFALAEKGKLPVGRLRYAKHNGDAKESATLTLTGERAWVQAGGATTELSAAQRAGLQSAAGDIGSPSALQGLHIERWVRDPESEDAGDLTRIRARLDVPRALDDLAGLLGRGSGLDDASRKQLEKAVKTSKITIETGADDRLLRRLDADLGLDFAVAPSLRKALGDAVGGTISLRVRIERPNQPVSPPKPPAGAGAQG